MPIFEHGHALLIGIANYQRVRPLPISVLNDVEDTAKLLVDPAYCGYDPQHVQSLIDGAATKPAILAALGTLAARASAESTVICYISSHGGQIEQGTYAGEYLIPFEYDNRSEAALAVSAISSAEFTRALQRITAQRVLIILDCCHAGGIGQPKDVAELVMKSGLSDQAYTALSKGRGRVILASSRSDELSWTGERNSVFTAHLLLGLRGGVASDDGLIRIFDLFEYVQPRVTAEKPVQHPVFRSDMETNFPIALYAGGQKGVIAADPDGFRYDAYISYVDSDPDAAWVWSSLVPRLKAAGLRVSVSGDVEEPGVYRIVNLERAITQAKRTLVVLSDAYLANNWAYTQAILAQNLGIQERTARVIPLKATPIEDSRLPLSISALTGINLSNPQRAEREYERLIRALQGPLPRW